MSCMGHEVSHCCAFIHSKLLGALQIWTGFEVMGGDVIMFF